MDSKAARVEPRDDLLDEPEASVSRTTGELFLLDCLQPGTEAGNAYARNSQEVVGGKRCWSR